MLDTQFENYRRVEDALQLVFHEDIRSDQRLCVVYRALPSHTKVQCGRYQEAGSSQHSPMCVADARQGVLD